MARVGCFQSQAGVGPQIGFITPVGNMQGYLNLKGYKEFAAQNRPDGGNAWVTFSVSPTAVVASRATPVRSTITSWRFVEATGLRAEFINELPCST